MYCEWDFPECEKMVQQSVSPVCWDLAWSWVDYKDNIVEIVLD